MRCHIFFTIYLQYVKVYVFICFINPFCNVYICDNAKYIRIFFYLLNYNIHNLLTLSHIEACILYSALSRLEGAGYKMQVPM